MRDGYEAFAMYCFGRYLVACLGTSLNYYFTFQSYYPYIALTMHSYFMPGGEDRTIEFLKREGGSGSAVPLLGQASEQRYVNHPFPMNYMLKPWPLGEWFYLVIKFGLVQYVCASIFDHMALQRVVKNLTNKFSLSFTDDNKINMCYSCGDS
jgi:hypothetical protein